MIYTHPVHVIGIAIGISVVAALIGGFLLWKRKVLILALAALGVSAMAGGIFVPLLIMDRVVLDDEKLEQATGFWFAPNVKGFGLADVVLVTISTGHDRYSGMHEVWVVTMKDGQTKEIDPGDLWEQNGPDIISRLRDKGIEVR